MSIIKFLTVDSSTVSVTKDDKEFGLLKFEGFFRRSITAITRNNDIYDFVRTAFWSSRYEFRQGNEIFTSSKILPFGKMIIENKKSGAIYILKITSFFRNKFDLIDEKGELLFHITVKRGFLVTIKNALIETTDKFDNIKEQFLICCAVLLIIKQYIRRRAAAAS